MTVDAGDRIVEWNARAEGIFGWPAAQAVGRRFSETVLPSSQREAHRRAVDLFLVTGEGPDMNRRVE